LPTRFKFKVETADAFVRSHRHAAGATTSRSAIKTDTNVTVPNEPLDRSPLAQLEKAAAGLQLEKAAVGLQLEKAAVGLQLEKVGGGQVGDTGS
jgi:hypothetical protein